MKVYNLEGKEAGDIELSDAVFDVKIKPAVVHEVFTAQMGNQRESWAHTKTRGDVRGGGKKPWRQKGTGRARHGSIRSPIWVGGGVTFGPLSTRNYRSKINNKIRAVALRMCLTGKVQDKALLLVENFGFAEPRTKLFAKLLKSLPTAFNSYLVLTGAGDKNIYRMTKNIKKIKTMKAIDVNVMEVLSKQGVVMTKEAVAEIEKNLNKK